ncbi:MAG TPA: lipid asymmetry maintenance ABC transporter permease subunit MlaE [Candidatus Azoamicus sp.]
MKKIFFIVNKIESLGLNFINFIVVIGRSVLLLKSVIFSKLDFKKDFKQFLKHVYFIGVLSLGIIVLSALFIGMVVGLQGHYILQKFGTEEIVGQMSALTIIRELGPVVSALLFTGRTGASLTAEICLMKSTEQLLALEMMGIDTIKKVIAPRFWAGLISMALLSLIFIVVALFGSYLSTVCFLNLDNDVFWMSIRENVDFKIDIVNSIVKSFIFGFIITWISVFQGVDSKSTAEGVAMSTTNTVVYSSFIILGLNFFLTSIMFNWI